MRHSGAGRTRRGALIAIGTGLSVGLAGCTGSTGDGATDELQSQLDAVRSATEQYADPRAAMDEGFQFTGPYVPGMGWHFINTERVGAAAENGLDRETPQILTYVETDDGLALGSVEYAGPMEAVAEDPDLFADENAEASEDWHPHDAATHVFANGDGSQTDPADVPFESLATKDYWTEFHPPDQELSAGDAVSLNWGAVRGKEGERTERVADIVATHPTLNTLHVWVHEDNPEGVFHPTNSRFGAEEHGHEH